MSAKKEKCACFGSWGPNPKCTDCSGHGFVTRYLWADGEYHNEPAPSTVPIPIPPPLRETVSDAPTRAVPPPIEIPMAWQPNSRHLLRQLALDFALKSAALMNVKTLTGEELLQSAERIEQWLVVEIIP
jgi:hypothetical protein